MSKEEKKSLAGKVVKSTEDLGNGYVRITFTDGTAIVCQIVPIDIKVLPKE